MPNDKIVQIDRRLSRLEAKEREEEQGQDLTLRVVYWETYFNEAGERCGRRLPATYNENKPFPESPGAKRRIRVLYPLEYPDEGPYATHDPDSPKNASDSRHPS